MQPFKIELNDMEALLDTYRQIMEKTAQAAQSIKKAQEAGTALMTAGATKDTVYNDSGVYRFSKVIEDFSATARVLHDYTGSSLKQFVDMDKLLAKQMYEAIQKDPKVDPKLKQYIQENPEQASQDMYQMAKDPEGFKQKQEKEQKRLEAEASAQAEVETQTQTQTQAQVQTQYPYQYETPSPQQTQQTVISPSRQQPLHQVNQQPASPEKIDPVKSEPEKTDPVKSEPIKSEPEKTDPVKTEPEKTEPVATEPTSPKAKSDKTVASKEMFFNAKAKDVWGTNHKDGHTILKETIKFNQPEQKVLKKEAVNTGFPSIKVENKSEKAASTLNITEETKMDEALNQFFTRLAKRGGE